MRDAFLSSLKLNLSCINSSDNTNMDMLEGLNEHYSQQHTAILTRRNNSFKETHWHDVKSNMKHYVAQNTETAKETLLFKQAIVQ